MEDKKSTISNSIIGKLDNNVDLDKVLLSLDVNKNKIDNLDFNKLNLNITFSENDQKDYKKALNLLKLLLNNDGSMTNFLKIIIENKKSENSSKLQMDLIENKIYDLENSLPFKNFIHNIQAKYGFIFNDSESNKVIKRIIEFYYEENKAKKHVMYGISFWVEDKYNSLYETEEEKKKPIGVILKEKKVEFFKEIENFYWRENDSKGSLDGITFIRISKFFRANKLFFFLIETFDFAQFIELLS